MINHQNTSSVDTDSGYQVQHKFANKKQYIPLAKSYNKRIKLENPQDPNQQRFTQKWKFQIILFFILLLAGLATYLTCFYRQVQINTQSHDDKLQKFFNQVVKIPQKRKQMILNIQKQQEKENAQQKSATFEEQYNRYIEEKKNKIKRLAAHQHQEKEQNKLQEETVKDNEKQVPHDIYQQWVTKNLRLEEQKKQLNL